MSSINPNTLPLGPNAVVRANNPYAIPPLQQNLQDSLQDAEEVQKTAGAAALDSGKSMLNFVTTMMFFDEESSGQLSVKEKINAVLLGLVSLIGFSTTASLLAGLDPNMGTITPLNKDAAKNSIVGRVAQRLDQIAPDLFKQGSLEGKSPTWLRAYLGNLNTEEYTQLWLKNHQDAVNKTITKLSKAGKGTAAEGSLPQRYAAHYEQVANVLKETTQTGNYEKYLTPEQMKLVAREVMDPFLKNNVTDYVQEPRLKPAFEGVFKAQWQALENGEKKVLQLKADLLTHAEGSDAHTKISQALHQAEGQYQALREGFRDVSQGHGFFRAKEGATPLIRDFETFAKQQPHRIGYLLDTMEDGHPAQHAIHKAGIDYATELNAPAVKHTYLKEIHKSLCDQFQFFTGWNTQPWRINATTGKALTAEELATNPTMVKDLEKSVYRLQEVGNWAKKYPVPFSRLISKLSTSEQGYDTLREQALKEITDNRGHWEALLGPKAVEEHLGHLGKVKSNADFFKLNKHFTDHARLTVKDFKSLHEVMPRSLKRLMQNVVEHEQFIHSQESLSNAWGVKGLGRGLASAWHGMIDMAKFNIHETPGEVLERCAIGMSGTLKQDASHAVAKYGKSFAKVFLSNPMRLGFFIGAVQAFSAGWAAFMTAGKPSTEAVINTPEKGISNHVAPSQNAAKPIEKKNRLGEQTKSFLRAFVACTVPMVAAQQLFMFLNRGNRLAKILGSHYLTSVRVPGAMIAGFGFIAAPNILAKLALLPLAIVPIGPHWMTGAGGIIGIGGQFVTGDALRKVLEKIQDKTIGKPQYLMTQEEGQKAVDAVKSIQDREFESLKKEDLALIAKYPNALKKAKLKAPSPTQLEEAYRLAGHKKAKDIAPQEAALLYTLATASAPSSLPTRGTAPVSTARVLSPEEAAFLYILGMQGKAKPQAS
ncbi:MAG: hypothetical protein HEQ32_05165 [Vampirovibrio sp.]